MVSRVLVSFEITRPHNMLAAGLCVAAGYRVAGGYDASTALSGAVVAALVTGAGNIINDFYDLDIDRVNKPRRPLPSQRLTARWALLLYALLSVVALGAAVAVLPIPVAALVLVWQVALFAYAARLKRVFVLGNVVVAAITSSAFVAGAMLAHNPGAAAIPFAIAFVFVLSREMVKGAEDVEGDLANGVETLAVVLGMERTVVVAAVMMLTLAILIPAPSLARHYGFGYLWAMVALVVPTLVGGAYLILEHRDRRTFNRVSWMLKVGMFFGILAIALARA